MRREPIYVYRRRRVAVAAVLLVFLALTTKLACGNGGGESAATTTTVKKPTTTTTLPKPDACAIGDIALKQDPSALWASIVVDTARRLDAAYAPPDLVDAKDAGFPSGFKVRQLLIGDLSAMRLAADANGTPISLIAAYRTYAQQNDLYSRRERQLGVEVAKQRAARAGHSEHQLGTAIDLGNKGDIDVTQQWGTTPTGLWVAQHATDYGFVLSYPPGKIGLTCYDYEPWHLRYVGRDKAAKVKASGLTLREYLWAEALHALPG
jgi:D-alanyl-D-alanine carboxypeptidase